MPTKNKGTFLKILLNETTFQVGDDLMLRRLTDVNHRYAGQVGLGNKIRVQH